MSKGLSTGDLTTAPPLTHLISKVLHGIYMRFTRGSYIISKSGGSIYFCAFSGVLFLGTLFTRHCMSGIQNLARTVNLYICHCIMYIVRNGALHHITLALLRVYTNWYLHLKVADQHSRSFVWYVLQAQKTLLRGHLDNPLIIGTT